MSIAVSQPRGAELAIGLPVRNGENFLADALASILEQTFSDFRLVIADNASTDRTEAICREFASRDERVTYIRHPENIGAARNFNFVFQVTPCRYFKWAAHDDILAPEYLARCMALLRSDPAMVLAHTYTNEIDAAGRVLGRYDDQNALVQDRPSRRLEVSFRMRYPSPIWGVMRADAVRRTRLFESYYGSDLNFLREMLLQGPIGLAPEYLFSVRRHEQGFSFGFHRNTRAMLLAWFDPALRRPKLPFAVRLAVDAARAIMRHPLPPSERMACLGHLGMWSVRRMTSKARHTIRRTGKGGAGGRSEPQGTVATPVPVRVPVTVVASSPRELAEAQREACS